MKEDEVITHVQRWLAKEYPAKENWVRRNQGNYGSDLDVMSFCEIPAIPKKTTFTFIEQIECKGSGSDVYKAIGQCLCYYSDHKVPTSLAIPKDYRFMGQLQKVIGELNLPLGLLIIDEKGNVVRFREPVGSRFTQLA